MFNHISVLLKETLEGLNIDKDGIYVDATLGGGGHTEEILKILNNGSGYVVGIDQDIDAITNAHDKLKKYVENKKLILVKDNFENINRILDENKIDKISGILFDLGVSSYQFDTKERGFTYREEARLDMRMDRDTDLDCHTLINTYPEDEIYRIIKEYGEEKFAKNIAKHICIKRKEKTIDTTTELLEVIKGAIPAKFRWGDGNEKNPGKRTFQALRIYINRELAVIEVALDSVVDRIKEGGRIAVITFHSLEDKLVKNKFKTFENPCICPKGYPCVCGKKSKGRVVKKSITASDKEIAANRRARSSRLRIFERSY